MNITTQYSRENYLTIMRALYGGDVATRETHEAFANKLDWIESSNNTDMLNGVDVFNEDDMEGVITDDDHWLYIEQEGIYESESE